MRGVPDGVIATRSPIEAQEIIATQRREIAEMKYLISQIEEHGLETAGAAQ